MNSANIPEFLQMQCLRDSGILEIGYDLLIALENVYSEFIAYERDRAETKQELKRALAEDTKRNKGR